MKQVALDSGRQDIHFGVVFKPIQALSILRIKLIHRINIQEVDYDNLPFKCRIYQEYGILLQISPRPQLVKKTQHINGNNPNEEGVLIRSNPLNKGH